MRKPLFVTLLVTCYLLTYHIFFQYGISMNILAWMFIASPFLLIWMVITILKYGKYTGRELEENEEPGAEDQ